MAAPLSIISSLAWRDSRGVRRRLILYISAMALGVASLVAIRSFGINLQRAVSEQSKELFGADLQVRRGGPFPKRDEALFDSLATENPGAILREATFPSMARFQVRGEGEGRTRLVQVRGLDGPFPLYGSVETDPVDASTRFASAEGALVDATLLIQMEANVGDTVRVGSRSYPILGQVDGVAGQPEIASLVGPRVYLPLAQLDSTLLGFGSRVRYIAAFRFDDPRGALAAAEPRLRKAKLRFETSSQQQADVGNASDYLTRFLSLVGFVALLLGGIGVASSISVYVREKADTVATLRCLGLSSRMVLAVYALQALALGLVGAVIGAGLGVAVQRLLPLVLASFLPVDVSNAVVPRALFEGVGIGLLASLLFALIPLAGIRRVPPLRALRADAEARGFDLLRWLLVLVLVAAVTGFAYLQTESWRGAGAFVAGTAAVFLLLVLASIAVRWLVRLLVRPGLPYAWRQGLANLYSPGNQTLVLMLTLGLGVFLVLTLAMVQRSILDQVALPTAGGEAGNPDVILFDIQPDQRDTLRALVESQGLPVIDEVPIVQMRIAVLDGMRVDSLLNRADTTEVTDSAGPERWALGREYRSTYRSELVETEQIVAGTFTGTAPADTSLVPISMEVELARDLQVGVGSTITWDIGGVEISTEISSLREVDWARVQPNFFVVFPEGPLDEAPQTSVLLTYAGSPERSARLQSAVVDALPNVSAVDVSLVLRLVDRVLARVAFVLRFMALFAVLTGLVVLAGSVRVALQQRTREAVLLRTIGASRAQVRRILVAEYALLGLLAALTGGGLAAAGAWGLATYAFKIPFVADPKWLMVGLVVVPLLTVTVGLLGSRSALSQPPLAVLRAE